MKDNLYYMNKALELAAHAADTGEVPVGAVVVCNDTGEIIGCGFNRRECDFNPLAHAEIEAIYQASQKLGRWRLSGCSLYVTLEPCAMCCGAIINSRIDYVFFGAYDKKSGSVVSVQQMFSLPYNHKPQFTGGIAETQCAEILSAFFRKIRFISSYLGGSKMVSLENEWDSLCFIFSYKEFAEIFIIILFKFVFKQTVPFIFKTNLKRIIIKISANSL